MAYYIFSQSSHHKCIKSINLILDKSTLYTKIVFEDFLNIRIFFAKKNISSSHPPSKKVLLQTWTMQEKAYCQLAQPKSFFFSPLSLALRSLHLKALRLKIIQQPLETNSPLWMQNHSVLRSFLWRNIFTFAFEIILERPSSSHLCPSTSFLSFSLFLSLSLSLNDVVARESRKAFGSGSACSP